MLKPRDEILLDVVGEVLRNGLSQARVDIHESVAGSFAELSARVDAIPALETKVDELQQHVGETHGLMVDAVSHAKDYTDECFKALPPPPDLAPLTEKIAALETREPEVTLEKLRLMGDDLEETVERRLAMLPPPVDLTPFAKQAEVDERLGCLAAVDTSIGLLHARVAAIEALPPPQKGDPGDPGPKGSPGEPGKDGTSVTIDQVRDLLDTAFAKWALDVERRIMDMAQKAIDRMPMPKDGVDGLSFDDIEFESIDHRTLECRGIRDGVVVKTHVHHFATPFDRGVWKAGVEYHIGDGVTWDGSWWIAKKDKPQGKPGTDDGFRLAVKKGRDGKNGLNGSRGEKGDAGPRGQNLTALMPDGSRFP